MSAEDKGSGNKEAITITNDQNREDIERMVNEAERYAEEDKKVKEKVESRNELESYAYSLKNQVSDKEKLGAKLSEEDSTTIMTAVEEAIEWLDSNQDADTEEYQEKKKALEEKVNPIISKLCEQSGGAPPPQGGEEDYGDAERDEL